jgi:hypothetical protein
MQRVVLVPRTRAARLYGATEATEGYYCNYGVNPDYRLQFEACGLRVSGVGDEGEIRIVELPEHLLLVTRCAPQARSTRESPIRCSGLRGRGDRRRAARAASCSPNRNARPASSPTLYELQIARVRCEAAPEGGTRGVLAVR